MDYLMLTLIIIVSLIIAYILLWGIGLLIVGVAIVGIGTHIAENIVGALKDAEYGYTPYLYKKYKVFKIKKEFGVIYRNEPFIWTDEQEEEQRRIAFEYATTPHDVKQ
jgi:hypothetical protein